jgi:hypothetical protein
MNKTTREIVTLDPPSPLMAIGADWPQLAHRELVRRIVVSATFAKSERLRSLLIYVCDMALKGREGEVNEQKIGHAVFGRSMDYDSSIDGIVRTQASRLRQRLDLYFEQEGANEPVRIVIPRGSYVPLFQPHTHAPRMIEDQPEVQPASSAVAAPPELPAYTQYPRSMMVLWGLCIALTLGLTAVLVHDYSKRDAGAFKVSTHPLWSQIFSPTHPTLEVPGDSGLVLYHYFDGRSVPLSEYLLGDYRSAKANAHALPPETENPRIEFGNRRYTSIVDLDAAATLAQIAQAAHSTMQVRYARDLRPNDLKAGNVILIGAFEANPWVELFERNMNFSLHNDYKTHVFSVMNRSPQGDEPTHWDSTGTDPQRRVYGLVAFAPNLSGSGNALLVEGTSMAGTEAAWDFVSDDSELLPFLKRIQRPDGTLPHFELLLGTQNMSSSAVHSNLIAWRVTN